MPFYTLTYASSRWGMSEMMLSRPLAHAIIYRHNAARSLAIIRRLRRYAIDAFDALFYTTRNFIRSIDGHFAGVQVSCLRYDASRIFGPARRAFRRRSAARAMPRIMGMISARCDDYSPRRAGSLGRRRNKVRRVL